uniref:Remorin C-terminal domain-containing protein n=1 Tax=Oryza brachyantha TaxID=4533 RepID=J3LFH2_ORYBR
MALRFIYPRKDRFQTHIVVMLLPSIRLRRKEADINDWQMKKVTQAKEKMKRIEIKLEKKREKAAERMQKAIKYAQKTADKKKHKETAATDNQIARVENEVRKMSRTDKLPWSLAFL